MRVLLTALWLFWVFVSYAQDISNLHDAIESKDYALIYNQSKALIAERSSNEKAYGNWGLGVYFLRKNLDSAGFYFEQAMRYEPDDKLKVQILNSKATRLGMMGLSRESVDLLLEATSLSKQQDLLPKIYNNISIGYRALSIYDSSIYFGLEGLRLAESAGQQGLVGILYNSIGNTLATQGEFDQAEDYYQQSVAVAISLNDSASIYKKYINLALLNLNQKKPNEASNYLDMAVPYLDRGNVLALYQMYSRLGLLYSLEEDTKQLALENYRTAMNFIISEKYYGEMMLLYMNLAELEITDNLQLSKIYLDSAKYFLLQGEGYENYLMYSEIEKKILLEAKELEELLTVQERIDSLRQIRFDSEKSKAIEELKISYETEKKEQQIHNLQREKEIAELKISQQRAFLAGGIAFALVLSIAGFTFYRNRTLRLDQKRLMSEQRLLRSQMNPHFLFNALSAIHSYVFQGDKIKAAEYLSVFSNLTRDILDHSGEEWISLQEELDTLVKYLKVQQIRFPSLQYELEVKSLDLENIQFPPLLLQPFIENAIEHGFKGSEGGKIDIHIQCHEDLLQITICDDGKGLGNSSNSKFESKAIDIARDRLDLLFGKDSKHQLILKNRQENAGVQVELQLPYIELI